MKVLSVDIGFGSTKYLYRDANGIVQSNEFPSFAPIAGHTDLSGGYLARRNTVCVSVNENAYEVGPDVVTLIKNDTPRYLINDYCLSDRYLAILFGVLWYCRSETVDLLVVGLPVSQLATHQTRLKHRLLGLHVVNTDFSCLVKNVLVLAQPIGGLLDYANESHSYSQLRHQTNLVIDPGYFTLDWLVTRGLQPNPRWCGSNMAGVHTIIHAIADIISNQLKTPFSKHLLIERGLLEGYIKINGRRTPMDELLKSVMPVIAEAVIDMMNKIGDDHDIDNVVIVGGGAHLYYDAIATYFNPTKIRILQNPAFSNVRGFQIAGEGYMSKLVATA